MKERRGVARVVQQEDKTLPPAGGRRMRRRPVQASSSSPATDASAAWLFGRLSNAVVAIWSSANERDASRIPVLVLSLSTCIHPIAAPSFAKRSNDGVWRVYDTY